MCAAVDCQDEGKFNRNRSLRLFGNEHILRVVVSGPQAYSTSFTFLLTQAPTTTRPSPPEEEAFPVDFAPPYKSGAEPEHDLTAVFPTMDLETPSAIPTSGQCLDHLKLLEAFHVLREDVTTTDGLYGIHDAFLDDVYPTKGLDEKEAQLRFWLREKRWAIFVANAE
ncbi:MAG: hypothetical protein L6R36_006846 [Xanthoria steineri]|nr:MAG: hypothetical protein L6R36_006846 [Xanthoria steineri]